MTMDHEVVQEKIDPFVTRGDYKSALAIVRPALKKDPQNFYLRYLYAKLLGDWADELPARQQAKYKKEAVRILKPLMKRLRGKPMPTRFGLALNFFYQSKNWQGMYRFGKRFASVNSQKAFYAQGLGATLLAEDFYRAGRLRLSLAWSRRATKAWRQYDFKGEAYYFPFYGFAKALALSGDRAAALKQLKIAARKGKRKIDDWEFADVIEICQKP